MFSSFKQEVKFIPKIITVHDTIHVADSVVDIKLTEHELLKELIKQKCVLPHVAIAQIKIESGNFKSAICKENKNFAGIRTSNSQFVKRGIDGKPIKNRGHNVYDSYKSCVKDYIRIQNRYLKNIDGKYAENPEYVKKIKNLK